MYHHFSTGSSRPKRSTESILYGHYGRMHFKMVWVCMEHSSFRTWKERKLGKTYLAMLCKLWYQQNTGTEDLYFSECGVSIKISYWCYMWWNQGVKKAVAPPSSIVSNTCLYMPPIHPPTQWNVLHSIWIVTSSVLSPMLRCWAQPMRCWVLIGSNRSLGCWAQPWRLLSSSNTRNSIRKLLSLLVFQNQRY